MSDHVPGFEPVAKMDTPVGLFRGNCSCGWTSEGINGTEQRALWTATQHAVAKDGWKDQDVVVPLSAADVASLTAKAMAADLPLPEYLRRMALAAKPQKPRRRRDPAGHHTE